MISFSCEREGVVIDKVILILLFLALIAAACTLSAKQWIAPAQQTTYYAIDTAVAQANKPLSPTEALAATSARINTRGNSVWSTVAILFALIGVGVFALLFLRYGEGFLKQYRLWQKKRQPKTPGSVTRPIPRMRPQPMLGPVNPDDVIVEGEVWHG